MDTEVSPDPSWNMQLSPLSNAEVVSPLSIQFLSLSSAGSASYASPHPVLSDSTWACPWIAARRVRSPFDTEMCTLRAAAGCSQEKRLSPTSARTMEALLFPIASYPPILLLGAHLARTITVRRGFHNTKVVATVKWSLPQTPPGPNPFCPCGPLVDMRATL